MGTAPAQRPCDLQSTHSPDSEAQTVVRKLFTTLLAASALAVPAIALTSAAHPTDAQAATCQRWRLPKDNWISQSNGWTTRLEYFYAPYNQWYAVGYRTGSYNMVSTSVNFTNWSADLVRFSIVWQGGSEGVYTGTIAPDGHVTGTTVDRWHPQYRAYWDMGYVSCAQY
jgi:hypothetical protein